MQHAESAFHRVYHFCIFYWWTQTFLSFCRTVSFQKSCSLLGLLLLGVGGRISLSRVDSRLCSGGLLHGLRVNIHRQLCTAFRQPEKKARNWRNEGEGWIRQCHLLNSTAPRGFLLSWSQDRFEKRPFSHCIVYTREMCVETDARGSKRRL